MDLYYSFTQDKGEIYVEVAWDVNPDSDGNFAGETVYRWDFLAKGEPERPFSGAKPCATFSSPFSSSGFSHYPRQP